MTVSRSSPFASEDTLSSPAEVRLVDLPLLEEAEVIWIEKDRASLVFSFGLFPGVRIQLRQRRPSYVIQCDETEIALEELVARQIWVTKVA